MPGGDSGGIRVRREGGGADVKDQVVVIAVDAIVVELQLEGSVAVLVDSELRRTVDRLIVAELMETDGGAFRDEDDMFAAVLRVLSGTDGSEDIVVLIDDDEAVLPI